jgi:signal-transduction protein with cAMP-binding, CBS, and nucleotidyltransferase domain
MTSKRIRHLPVVDESGLCGIVTIGDLLVQQAGEHAATIEYLESYIYGGR